MQKTSHHIIFKLFTVLVVLVMLAPTFVKLGHVYENHKHEVCLDKSTTHFHTFDLECEFYKFKVNSSFVLQAVHYTIFDVKPIKSNITSQYSFLSKYQRLHFNLRGPPVYS